MEIRIGVIGTGLMGAYHAETISRQVSGASLAAVSRRAGDLSSELPSFRVHADPHALIADPDVDAVLVASPDETHLNLVLACINAGKPVLCEKPLAPTPQECLRIVEAEVAAGRQLVQVGFHRRFDPAYIAMKKTLGDGELGTPLLLHCVHRNSGVPAHFTSEMMITNAAVHDIDIMRWLIGEELATARVIKSRSRPAVGICDPQLLLIATEGGIVASIEVYMNAKYGYDIRAEMVCETGTVSLGQPVEITLRHAGMDTTALTLDFRSRFAAAYRSQLQTWVNCIESATSAGASAWDGYVATAAAGACVESLVSGSEASIRLVKRPALYQ
jgi:myo-inositol 2-dehydrogenase/D-chiro-inositol 1-dehydrogenase